MSTFSARQIEYARNKKKTYMKKKIQFENRIKQTILHNKASSNNKDQIILNLNLSSPKYSSFQSSVELQDNWIPALYVVYPWLFCVYYDFIQIK